MTEKGKRAVAPKFTDGQFTSVRCVQYGFSAAPYTSEKKSDGTISLRTEVPSSKRKGAKMSWEGTVRGDSLTSEVAWTNSDGKTLQYSVEAKKAQ